MVYLILEASITAVALLTFVALVIDIRSRGVSERESKVYAKVAKWWLRFFLMISILFVLLIGKLLKTDSEPTVWEEPGKDSINQANKFHN